MTGDNAVLSTNASARSASVTNARDRRCADPAFILKMVEEITPSLREIVGFSNVISGGVAGQNKRLAKTISEKGSHLMKTLVGVLDLLEIENESARRQTKRVDVVALVREVMEAHRPRLRARGLSLQFIDPGLLVEADVDPAALRQILSAVLSNAVNFTTEGGVTIGVRPQDGRADVVIKDTGCGFSRAFLPQAFEAFAREDLGDADVRQGCGLGLTIAARLAKMLGGDIAISSTRGSGATCTVSLPAASQQKHVDIPDPRRDTERPPADGAVVDEPCVRLSHDIGKHAQNGAARPSASLAGPSDKSDAAFAADGRPAILLVEDNAVTRRVMKMMLKSDYNVLAVAEVDEALRSAEEHRFDLLLLDIALNERRTGVEVLHAIRKTDGYEDIPAIACTAYSLPGIKERYLEIGFTGYLGKPFHKEQLLDLIETVLAARVHVPEDRAVKESVAIELPPLPQTLPQVLTMMSDGGNGDDLDELSDVLAGDPVVSAWVLQHANSAFHGVRGEVASIERAITLLGLDPVCSLVVAGVLAQTFSADESRRSREVCDHLLRGSVATAAFARELAAARGIENPEMVFTAGLLHDVGRLCLLSTEREKYAELWYDRGNDEETFGAPTIGQELMRFSIDHQMMGIEVSKEWDLPIAIDQVVRHYWEPEKAVADVRPAVQAVAAGRAAAALMTGAGSAAPESRDAQLEAALEALSDSNPDIAARLRTLIDSKTEEVGAFVEAMTRG